MQRQINLTKEFCDTREMKVNLNKTEIIVFRNGGPLREYEMWDLGGTPIRTTSEYKYMGLIFTPKLSWSKAKRKLAFRQGKLPFVFETISVSSVILSTKNIFDCLTQWLNLYLASAQRYGDMNIQV